jgi:hypothetical protein
LDGFNPSWIASIRFFLLIWSQLLILGVVSGLRTLWLLYHSTGIYTWQAAYLRLFPLLIWVVLICLQILLFLLLDQLRNSNSLIVQNPDYGDGFFRVYPDWTRCRDLCVSDADRIGEG